MENNEGLEYILLIDDDKVTNFLNQHLIKQSKIKTSIKVANSPLEALIFLKKNNTLMREQYNSYSSLILLDINMPEMNGWEFLEQISKQKINLKNAVIVILSSSIDITDIKMAKENEKVKEFMSKPLKTEDMKKLVKKYFSY